MALDDSTAAALRRLGAATLHEAQGQSGAMASAIKPIEPAMRLLGTAATVYAPANDNLMIHYALSKAQPGDVLVVDAQGFVEGGAWGDLMTTAAQAAGIAGLVIDGAVRDSSDIIAMGFPIFARALSIKGTVKTRRGRYGEPVCCGGVTVHPGDIVLGDRDGVVVIARDRLAEVIAAAEAREAKEEAIRTRLEAGESTVEVLEHI